MSKVAVLLAEGFETIEALTVVDILRRAEVSCDTFALKDLKVTTSHKIQVLADKLLDELKEDQYDFIVLPGGMPGSKNLKEDVRVIKLLKTFNEKNKWICAICAAPIALGKAEVVKGKDVTCYPGFEEEIKEGNCKEDLVVCSQNVITAKGPAAAVDFAFEILSKISEDKVKTIKSGMLF